MKVLFIPERDSYYLELIAENKEEETFLTKVWDLPRFMLAPLISCEQWREICVRRNT